MQDQSHKAQQFAVESHLPVFAVAAVAVPYWSLESMLDSQLALHGPLRSKTQQMPLQTRPHNSSAGKALTLYIVNPIGKLLSTTLCCFRMTQP